MKYFFSSLLLLISIYANAQTPAFFNKTKLLFVNAPLEKKFSDWVKYFADNKGRFELETNTNPFEYLYSVAAKDIDTQYIPFNGKFVSQIKKYDDYLEIDSTVIIPVESFLIGVEMKTAINKKEINQFFQKQKEDLSEYFEKVLYTKNQAGAIRSVLFYINTQDNYPALTLNYGKTKEAAYYLSYLYSKLSRYDAFPKNLRISY
jgi:hypothetical protein